MKFSNLRKFIRVKKFIIVPHIIKRNFHNFVTAFNRHRDCFDMKIIFYLSVIKWIPYGQKCCYSLEFQQVYHFSTLKRTTAHTFVYYYNVDFIFYLNTLIYTHTQHIHTSWKNQNKFTMGLRYSVCMYSHWCNSPSVFSERKHSCSLLCKKWPQLLLTERKSVSDIEHNAKPSMFWNLSIIVVNESYGMKLFTWCLIHWATSARVHCFTEVSSKLFTDESLLSEIDIQILYRCFRESEILFSTYDDVMYKFKEKPSLKWSSEKKIQIL